MSGHTLDLYFASILDESNGLIPDYPSKLPPRGQFGHMPFIAGTNLDEGQIILFLMDWLAGGPSANPGLAKLASCSEWQGFSAGKNLLPLPLPSKILTLGQEYEFSGGKRTGFCNMGRRRTSSWHMQFSSPRLFLWRNYTIECKTKAKKRRKRSIHGCGVIVGLLKKRGMRRTYLLHVIKPLNCLFPRREAPDTHIDSTHIPTIGLYPTVPML